MRVKTLVLRRLGLLLLVSSACTLHGGGSGLNVVVVVNQNSTNSVQLGNYYCEQRQVPPQNLLRITNWTGGRVEWTSSDFTNYLFNPLLSMLSSQQLTNQIDYVVLSTDIPYRVAQTNGNNSTTSALFYGFKTNDCPACQYPGCTLPDYTSNSYAGSEDIFRAVTQFSTNTNSFLVTMITSSNLAQAKAVVDSGVASDGTFPTQTVYLAKSITDVARNIRYRLFDNAVFDTRLRGNYSVQRTNANTPAGLGYMLGYQGGWMNPNVPTNIFAPGALADNLTSFGGQIFENSGHTVALAFLNGGASGSYGTVVEPCAYLEKFPTPQDYFYQARGFSLAECYYQSLMNPYQGILVGEPLAAPFAQPASGLWSNLPPDAQISGTTNLTVQFIASDTDHPVQQVDLFLDGLWLQTLTNLPPRPFNKLYVTINGYSTNYTVPANATIKSVASNLTVVLNNSSFTNATKVSAFAHGDRIELQSFDLGTPGSQIPISVSNSIGSATALTTFISASCTNFLDTLAYGLHNLVVNSSLTYPPPVNSWLLLTVTKTNGAVVTVGVTNAVYGTTIPLLVSNLVNQVNANPQLMFADGCYAEDFIDYSIHVNTNNHGAEFNLRAGPTAGTPHKSRPH